MFVGTSEALRSIPSRSLHMGAGGLVLEMRLDRVSQYTERYYIFPMILIGSVVCLVPFFNTDITAFIGTRLGFSFLGILTALAASNDITPVSANGQQLTVVDRLSIWTIVCCGLVAFESLLMYVLWITYECTPTDLRKGWFIRCADFVFAILMVVIYIWASCIIIFQYKDQDAMWVAVIVGLVILFSAMGLSFVVVRRMYHSYAHDLDEDGNKIPSKSLRDEFDNQDGKKHWWNKAAYTIPEAWHRFGAKVAPQKRSAKQKSMPSQISDTSDTRNIIESISSDGSRPSVHQI